MLNHFWWGAIFLINIPVAALGLVAVVALVPESKNPPATARTWSAPCSPRSACPPVFAIISGPEHGWTPAGSCYGAVAASSSAPSRLGEPIPYPMLDMHFFRNQRFTGAVAGAVLITFGMGGSLFLLTQHLQFVLGYGPLEAGSDGAARARRRRAQLHRTAAHRRGARHAARHRVRHDADGRAASGRSPCWAGGTTAACCSA